MLVVHVEQADGPARLVASHERDLDRRLFHLRAWYNVGAVLLHGLRHVLVDDQCFARTHYLRRESFLSQGLRHQLKTYSVLIRVRIVNQIGLCVVNANTHVSVAKDVPDLVAHRVVDALDIELGRQRSLHAVDNRQLGVALLGLL